MKRFFITTLVLFFSGLAIAQHNSCAILHLRIQENIPFKVYVDGRPFTKSATQAHINDFPLGKHVLQVFAINRFHGAEIMENVYKGYISLAANTEYYVTVLPRFQELQFDRTIALYNQPWLDQDRDEVCFYPKPPVNHTCATTEVPQLVPIGPQPMNPAMFNQLKQTIDHATFESTKLQIFRQALNYQFFTAEQVCEIMSLFTFESTKLDVAKLAYPRTLDQQNYFIVNNSFTFSSSVNELGNYIAMR